MRVLVLSGGGSKGGFQNGALRYILGELKVSYDAFCGISVGALNAAFLAQFKKGEEQLAADELNKLWHRVDTKKIYKRWFPFGILHGAWLPSLKNSRPLLDWINTELDLNKIRNSGKICQVGAVSLNTGEYRLFDQNYIEFNKAVAASSSFPGYLIPIQMEGQLWSDGGIKEITPLQAAIDLGADEIDIIITAPKNDSTPFQGRPSAIKILKRTVDLMSDEVMANDIDKALLYNQLVKANLAPNKRYLKLNIIRPDKNLNDDSMDFSPDKIKEMMDIGYQIAKSKYIL